MDTKKHNNGFSGLSDLVSDINCIDSQSVESDNAHIDPSSSSFLNNPKNDSKNKPIITRHTGRSASKNRWMILVVLFFLVIFIVTNGEQLSNLLITNSNPPQEKTGEPSTRSKVNGQSVGPNLRPELYYKKPPVGKNNVLSLAEIRWCLREDIRIEAMKSFVNIGEAIDEFNTIVDDYNCRCGSYQYRGGTQSQAERDVAPFRERIVHAAIQEALQMESRYQKAPLDNDQRKVIDTRIAQQLLKDLGYSPGPVDGMYGNRTASAVKKFQLDNGKLPDGKISQELLRDLALKKSTQ